MAASVVDFPDPVAPTIRISPRFSRMMSLSMAGRPRESSGGIMLGMYRTTTAGEPFCRKALMRKLPTPCKVNAVFNSSVSSYSFFCLSSITSWRRPRTVLASIVCWLMGMATPLILILMGAPTDRKMSEAFLSAISWNNRFIADIHIPSRRGRALLAAQQLVDAGLCAGRRVDLFHDPCTVQAVFAAGGG